MSFDVGIGDESMPDGDFSRKFDVLLDEAEISFPELCEIAGVDVSAAREAVLRGSDGLPSTLPILQRLLAVFRMDEAYLFNQFSIESRGIVEQRRTLRVRARDFCERHRVPESRRRAFVNYVVTMLDRRPTHTMRIAARASIPRTMVDFAFLYGRLDRDGFFN